MTYQEIKEYISRNSIDVATELREQQFFSPEELASAKNEDILERRKLAEQCGITTFTRPLVWKDALAAFEENQSPQTLDVLVWLMSGGSFDGSACSEERWITATQKYYGILDWIDQRRADISEFNEIMSKLSTEKIGVGDGSGRYQAIVDMLFRPDGEHIPQNADREILSNNLALIDGIIAAHPYLKRIEPLVYFKTLIKHKSRLLNTADFFPDLKKTMVHISYGLPEEQDKLFNRNVRHCQLYMDILDCYADCDNSVSDVGFIMLTNLAEWAYQQCDIEGEFPITVREVVERFLEDYGVCFGECSDDEEDSPFWHTIPVEVELLELKAEYPTLDDFAEKSAEKAQFSDLEEFVNNPHSTFYRLELESYAKRINVDNVKYAEMLFIDAMIERFNCLLADELCKAIEKYTAAGETAV